MKTIPLHGKYAEGLSAIVSDEDYEEFSKYWWTYIRDHVTPSLGYARTHIHKQVYKYMHREVVGDKKGYVVDHINRNTLDNRRENLRHLTPRESSLNRSLALTPRGYTKVGNRFQVTVRRNNKSYYVGLFKTVEEARSARQKALAIIEKNSALLTHLKEKQK